MLTPPDLSRETIAQYLADAYGLHDARIEFLPLGADVNSAVFRINASDGAAYFLKLRRGDFDQPVVAVPASLHHDKGIEAVMAPLPTTSQQLSTQSHSFDWALYPFFDGKNGFERTLTNRQWTTLGAALGAIHRTELPEALSADLPKEHYAHHWREGVRRYQRRFINGVKGDDIVKRFLAFWEEHAEEIDTVVYRSEQLASILLERPPQLVLCHSDLHAGNVLVGDNDRISIVDWDTLILAPKERDLMFIGGGVGHVWNQPQEEALFYEGYGLKDIDLVALAYYRYERIAKDVLEFCDQMFDATASAEDREEGLRQMQGQFLPGDVVAIAHRSYDDIT
ncbi:spectinomycin phosphotransferase [Variovorax sp. YR752]|uniref:aminoglycoside phosphotransferase family protein n=1 Tax=Variovorax sp. YR752 TaxID=1884383 RepID=UPI000BCDC8F8|nr:aminoglycoside phosphotransferase family protein [Variovorax sp. YR752]SOD27460.1 spectinomycin phosphotransferase [Variovorax sp. YR752]